MPQRPDRSANRWSTRSWRPSAPLGAEVETGVFGADMLVTWTNDGPVTLILDS